MNPAEHCDECGDDGTVYLHSRCHIKEPTWVAISGDVLTLECCVCGRVVARYRVADKLE